MYDLKERISYLKGLADGLGVKDDDTKESRVISGILDLLDDITDSIVELDTSYSELDRYVESMDEDLELLEDIVFDEDTEEYRQMVEVPNVIGLPLTEAAKQLKDAKLNYIGEETGTIVEDQMPKPGAEVMVDTTVLLYMKRENAQNAEQGGSGRAIVPDLAGKSIREANQLLSSVGLKMTIQGSGIAVSQQPEAGEEVDKGSTVTVKFDAPEEE